jgi:hypothetical protein
MNNHKAWKRKGGREYERDRLIVITEKLKRGECVLHAEFNNGARHFVTLHNHMEFAFDHLNRQDKFMHVSKMVGRYKFPERMIAEMNKCQLVCHNCHSRKGVRDNDHMPLQSQITKQLGLFDAI